MPIDTALVGALHVEYLKKGAPRDDEHPHHVLFQTSTIDALLEGRYDGDVSFAELEGRGAGVGLETLTPCAAMAYLRLVRPSAPHVICRG